MHIDPLERKWVYVTLMMTAIFVGVILLTQCVSGISTPSNVETIDSARLHLSKEFAEENLGVQVQADGTIMVRVVAGRYGFFPKQITVPADTRITFRWVSIDVLHGVHVPMTNMNTMIVPGYVSKVTTVFPKPGEYPMLCNEYCGMGHDHMWSKLTVVDKHDWQAPEQMILAGGESNE